MGEAIGQLLPFAVGVAVSPMPIVAVVLMLVTPPGTEQRPGVPARNQLQAAALVLGGGLTAQRPAPGPGGKPPVEEGW
jgi:hypothetical protein